MPSDGKSSRCLWHGELIIKIKNLIFLNSTEVLSIACV